MQQDELLRHIVKILERLELRYFVTGSIAAMYFGEPRFTNDIDIVLDLPETRISVFCAEFSSDDFYLSEETARRATKTGGQFNIIHPLSGLKIDLMVPTDSLFNRSRFQRAKKARPGADYEAMFASPEDIILKKMEYFQKGGSDKHLRDIAGILKISGETLDEEYIEGWADTMGLETLWRTLRMRALDAKRAADES